MSDRLSRIKSKKILALPSIWVCAGIFLYITASLAACQGKKSDTIQSGIDTLVYSSLTRDVSSLISDSGITKYKLEAPTWYTYEQPSEYWYFPEGLYVEQFDTLFHTQASIKADTAYYYQARKVWYLVGNVEVLNREGGRFFGNSLYWDEQTQEVYSREHTLIIPEPGRHIESKYGFKSNQSMTRYELYSSYGHVEVQDEANTTTGTTLPNDSTTTTPKDTLTIVAPLNPKDTLSVVTPTTP